MARQTQTVNSQNLQCIIYHNARRAYDAGIERVIQRVIPVFNRRFPEKATAPGISTRFYDRACHLPQVMRDADYNLYRNTD